jgi:GNAT superfamily N-acetyltransferase
MRGPLTVGPARPEEQAAALELAFQQMPSADRDVRVANALRLVRQGELTAEGILVARGREGLLGAMVCHPAPGASGLVWPPQAATARRKEVEDALLRHACGWLREKGAKLAQALLLPREAGLAEPLERNGFKRITSLWYLRHDLDGSGETPEAPDPLTYSPYNQDGVPAVFQETLLRTYEQTLDCPEVNGVRSLEEILAGHKAQGNYDPGRWWLALERDRPIGVLLLTELPEKEGWDVSYVGVVPEARGHGHGRALVRKALQAARAAGAAQLMLSVDARNERAWKLYTHLGFEPYEERAVYLAIWHE